MLRIGLALLGALAATPAVANDGHDRDWAQVRVDASALDLSTPAGIETLAGRIHKAVNRICGSDSLCRDQAWASTEDQVAWAIDRDEWMRRMAEERLAQLDACGGYDCAPAQPVAYPLPAPAPQPMLGGVTVTIIHTAPRIDYWR
jgi:UrcA family protein